LRITPIGKPPLPHSTQRASAPHTDTTESLTNARREVAAMAELTSSTREAARRLGVSDTTMHKAERTGRIAREPDGQWDIAKTRARLLDTADPQRSPLSGSAAAEGTPFARLKVAQLALKVEAQRLALDESKGRLLDVATANATIDEIASTMRDALLNWPARVAGVIAAELNVEPHLLQTILQQHINELLTEASDRFDPPGIGGEREPHA
jgi:DNA-binding XRE family transcriptional regulator